MVRIRRINCKALLAQLCEVVLVNVSTICLQVAEEFSQRCNSLSFWPRRLGFCTWLGNVGNHHNDCVSVWYPHVPDMTICLQEVSVVLAQLLHCCAIGPLVQCVFGDTLQGHLRDDSQGPHAHTHPLK